MAALRRSLVRIHQILSPTRVRPTASLLQRSRLNSSARYFSSLGNEAMKVDLSNEESKRQIINRLLYRSKQRGFLELDLVLGNWVEENIRSMDELRIKALVDVLDLENPDLWKWLTGQEQPPEAVSNNPVFTAVRSRVLENLKNHSAPEARANPGQPWVRGWDDKRGMEGPKYGNQ